MSERRQSASQTAGPYVHIGCVPRFAGLQAFDDAHDLGGGPCKLDGAPLSLSGRVLDGAGEPVADAMLEFWQADTSGVYSDAGWARRAVDAEGRFTLETVMPGTAGEAPHIKIWITARGINLGLHTRAYFALTDDPVLAQAGNRADTLVAKRDGSVYLFDIHLQGPNETVFLDV